MLRKKAQSINEYALVIAMITLAVVAMQSYFKRGIQGVIKVSADQLGAAAQQNGTEELGLYAYTQPAGPLVVTSNKTSTVTEYALSAVTIPLQNWNPYVVAYQWNYGGFIETEIAGNTIEYYDLNAGQEQLVGIEDALTCDFTTFDSTTGLANSVWDASGSFYTGLKFTDNKDSTVTVQQKIGQLADGTILYSTIGTYGKYQPVIISQVPATSSYSLPAITQRSTVNNETTNVSGGWNATYELGTDIYKPQPNPNQGGTGGTTPKGP